MNNVNLSGIIRQQTEAFYGQNTASTANLVLEDGSQLGIVILNGTLPQDETVIKASGKLTSLIHVSLEPREIDGELRTLPEISFGQKQRFPRVIVDSFEIVSSSTPADVETDSQSKKKPENILLEKVTVEGIGNDFIILNGETYVVTSKTTFKEQPNLNKQVRAYYFVDENGKKVCYGIYSVIVDVQEEPKKDTPPQGGNSGQSGKSRKTGIELKEALVTGGTEYGIFIGGLFYTRTRNTKGMKEMPKRGEVVNAKVSSTDPSDGVRRYLLSVYPAKQEQPA